ncbi:hypothetical protein P153DRAFT_146907 [Dothidotthia symphoricarpi CBS 119687]|uniref:Uncharacterized protein n=1 Tax=Dothidotthia symphoricarpi CBS 119687 TaxID=1392245 RepID=A0A6A5ZYF1_9PLEO|nr:uncharacterized protein P153DRAFT_146907 [Dothidotthia symphoricarpi CBS 119687]KAF2123807.1 hypothetical protein P153DRAFT_146907 [Dothidotthia symphoricarpi CBS 119687]
MPPNTRSTHRPSTSAVNWPPPHRYQISRKKKPKKPRLNDMPPPPPPPRHDSSSSILSTMHVRDIALPSVETQSNPADDHPSRTLKRPASLFLQGLGAEGRRVRRLTAASRGGSERGDSVCVSANVSRRVTPAGGQRVRDWKARLESVGREGRLQVDVRRLGVSMSVARGGLVGLPISSPGVGTSSPGFPTSSSGLPTSSSGLPTALPILPTPSPAPVLPSPVLPTTPPPSDHSAHITEQIQPILHAELEKRNKPQSADNNLINTLKAELKPMITDMLNHQRVQLSQDRFREFQHARKVLGQDRVKDMRQEMQALGQSQEVCFQSFGQSQESRFQSLKQHHEASNQSLGRWMQDGVKFAVHSGVADIRAGHTEALEVLAKKMESDRGTGVVHDIAPVQDGNHERVVLNPDLPAAWTTAIQAKVGETIAAHLASAMDLNRPDAWPAQAKSMMESVLETGLKAQFEEQFAASGLGRTVISDAVQQITAEASHSFHTISADYRRKMDTEKNEAEENMSSLATQLADLAREEAAMADKDAQMQNDARQHHDDMKKAYDELLTRSTTTHTELEQTRKERDTAKQCADSLETAQHETRLELADRKGQIVAMQMDIVAAQVEKQIAEEDVESLQRRFEEMSRRCKEMERGKALVMQQIDMFGDVGEDGGSSEDGREGSEVEDVEMTEDGETIEDGETD